MNHKTGLYLILMMLLGMTTFVGCLPDASRLGPPTTEPSETWVEADLKTLVLSTLEWNRQFRRLSVERNAAWQVLHGAVAYGKDLELDVDGSAVPALKYLFDGGSMRGWDLRVGDPLPGTDRRGVRVTVEEGSFTGQGHVDQFLGYLSQAKVPIDTPLLIHGQVFRLEDWARQAQRDICQNPYREYSWTLIALTNYFPNDTQWVGTDGQTWALESFVKFEAEQDLSRSACGGMHRLMGLAHAVRYRERLGGKMDGGWHKAKAVLEDAVTKAKRFQNSDGSFSTRHTERPSNSSDLTTCIGATGHTLEFLAFTLPAHELKQPWMERAVVRLCKMLQAAENTDLECGGGYHALAGLSLYASKRFTQID
jgi:hypothetical protein